MSYEEYAPWLPKGERAMSDTPYKWERDARANNAEAQVLFERARADAAEARVARLAGVLHTIEQMTGPHSSALALEVGRVARAALAEASVTYETTTSATVRLNPAKLGNRNDAPPALTAEQAALADVPGHEGGHSAPAAESAADTDTLLDSTDATLSGKPIMPTLTDEEHAAVNRTLGRTHEARQARKRDEAYRAMVTFCRVLDTRVARAALMVAGIHLPDELDRALALARQAEEG